VSHRDHAAAARSSLSAPRITILSASSGNGRCNAFGHMLVEGIDWCNARFAAQRG
jgi:hypothetical protein